MVQFASYLRRVLCKTRLIFPRINGPIMYVAGENSRLSYLLSLLGTFREKTPLAATSEEGGRLFSLATHYKR